MGMKKLNECMGDHQTDCIGRMWSPDELKTMFSAALAPDDAPADVTWNIVKDACKKKIPPDRPAPPSADEIEGFELTGEYRPVDIGEYFMGEAGIPFRAYTCPQKAAENISSRYILRPKPAKWEPAVGDRVRYDDGVVKVEGVVDSYYGRCISFEGINAWFSENYLTLLDSAKGERHG